MHSNKMVCAIKVAGKILREHSADGSQTVFIPFGSEYSFYLKNLSSGRRACVWITIDGKEAIDGGLVLGPNQQVDLERFIESGQMDKGLRFKFIERTEKIEQHRGIGAEDGLIKVTFEFERERPYGYTTTPYYPPGFRGLVGSTSGQLSSTRMKSKGSVSGSASSDVFLNQVQASYSDGGWGGAAAAAGDMEFTAYASASATIGSNSMAMPKNDAGITVGGSVSEQKFHTTSFDGEGIKHDMIFQIKGAVGQEPVPAPVTVKTKQKCPTCGHMNKSNTKFCAECGTGLVVV